MSGETIGELYDRLPFDEWVALPGYGIEVKKPTPPEVSCVRCTTRSAVGYCCSSHTKLLCHTCYRRTHFVEVCVKDCPDCAREGIAPRATAAGGAEGDKSNA